MILQLAERYIASHDISAGHARELRGHARRFGRPLSAETLNADLKGLRAAGRRDTYIRNRRVYVLMLWRYGATLDLLPDPPLSKIMRVRIRDVVPRGYDVSDVKELLSAAKKLRGKYTSGISRAAWWTSYLAAAWDTGLSTCDLLAVERTWIASDGTLTTVRHKTGRRVTVGFHESTLQRIDATFPPERRLVWPLTISREMMRRTFARIAGAAGVGGTLKWLRSGSGTCVEELHGHGEWHLGNTRQVFERHYLCHTVGARLPAEVR